MKFDQNSKDNVYKHLKSLHDKAVEELAYLEGQIDNYSNTRDCQKEKVRQLGQVLELLEKELMNLPF
jgi:peptidoglycan hydrolase CwlO-like protein